MKTEKTTTSSRNDGNTVLPALPFDGDGQVLHEGDRVYSYDYDKVLCAVGDFGDGNVSLPHKPDSSTNVQLTTSAPIAQNPCYKLAAVDYRKT